MNILVIGFGNMGLRHTQSLNNFADGIWIIEPNTQVLENNIAKLTNFFPVVNRVSSIKDIPVLIDIAVIATTSGPRAAILKQLLDHGIKLFLLEKITFQSTFQFDESLRLLESYQARAYTNFVNRYFPNYIELKQSLSRAEGPIKMIVNGGDIRLGSNALHYIDLFEYLTQQDVKFKTHHLEEQLAGSKKSGSYRELMGQVIFETERGDFLYISADEKRLYSTEIVIISQQSMDLINEQTMRHISYSDNLLSEKPFKVIYTSVLTKTILEDIINGNCRLPEVEESKNAHREFFKAANSVFGLNSSDICPLT